MACLERAEKQTELLECCGALMLLKKAQAVEDLKELECLKAETEGPEGSCSKRLYYKGSDADPSSSNTQAVASNSVINISLLSASGKANLSVDLSHLPFWDSSLADFFSSKAVDPLVLGNLGSRGGIP